MLDCTVVVEQAFDGDTFEEMMKNLAVRRDPAGPDSLVISIAPTAANA
jgi:hypothetical protein